MMRTARTADLALILDLETSGFPTTARWSPTSWAGELEADNRIVLVAEGAHGRLDGVASIQHVGGVTELNRIIVAPTARGRGVGRELLQAGIAAARDVAGEEMLLEVRHDNTPALALYARGGFVEIARRAGYYGTGVDAVIMRLGLDDEEDLTGDDE